MKRLILSLTVAAFALVPALQAGEDCAKSCADKAKGASCSDQAKSSCASACAKSAALKKAAKPGSKGAILLVQK